MPSSLYTRRAYACRTTRTIIPNYSNDFYIIDMSQALESVDNNDLTLEEMAALSRKPPPPRPRDPNYPFEKKTPDQYPYKTHYNYEKGSELTGRISRDREFRPGEGEKASPTLYFKKTTARGEIEKSGSSSASLLEKYGSTSTR